jgi:cell division protease FtsH
MNILIFFLLFYFIDAYKYNNPHKQYYRLKALKKYGDSMNGFSFNEDDLKLNLSDKRKYDIASKTRKMIEISKKKIQEENKINQLRNNKLLRPGYPKQAHMNITYPDIDDIDNDDEEFENIVKRLANPQEQISSNEIETVMKKMWEQQKQLNSGNNEGIPIIPGTSPMPVGIRVIKVKDGRTIPDGGDENHEKSENFEVIKNPPYNFDDVGGYQNVKDELLQIIDILKNYEKYQKYNVRTPKGLIFEGPPGNGKTLMAKSFSGEVNASFIPVSGSQFLEKFVGVGASRIRELFKLAKDNKPCIIFIDEIDAVGRSRVGNDQNPNSEAQATLNQLLVNMDGYESSDGIFIIGATNRADLLDSALLRPGRIDKRMYIGNPDSKTREAILQIHLSGKPRSVHVTVDKLKDITNGLSGAQIENLLNEAMLLSLRNDREMMNMEDIESILSRMLVGYQPNENNYSPDMIKRIAIHEMGHAIVGVLSLHHANLVKVCLNIWSPTSPGYTVFEQSETDSNIYTKEKLMSRLMVLLSGRIAEEVFFGESITSGASKDIEDAYSLAEQMIVKFGMGSKIVYPHHSEDSKNFIDKDIEHLIETTYHNAHSIILKSKDLIEELSNELITTQLLLPERITEIMKKYNL